jgi:hypothetical protein
MALPWRDAVIRALDRFSVRHASVQVERATFLSEELAAIVAATESAGRTPAQTVSRVLQELRDEGFLFFSSAGRYVLNMKEIEVTAEDLPDDVLDNAVDSGNLRLGDVDASNEVGQARLRRGMGALRTATLRNYDCRCALCDIEDQKLLVTSHIARWADRPEARGQLANTICFCSFHDKLFEYGYFGLSNDLSVVIPNPIQSNSIRTWLSSCTGGFYIPKLRPSERYLAEHRNRIGLIL